MKQYGFITLVEAFDFVYERNWPYWTIVEVGGRYLVKNEPSVLREYEILVASSEDPGQRQVQGG